MLRSSWCAAAATRGRGAAWAPISAGGVSAGHCVAAAQLMRLATGVAIATRGVVSDARGAPVMEGPLAYGLIGPTSTESHYATRLEDSSISAFSQEGALWDAHERDGSATDAEARMKRIVAKSTAWLQKGEVCGRKGPSGGLLEYMENLTANMAGLLVLVTGDKSVGKTFVLSHMARAIGGEPQGAATRVHEELTRPFVVHVNMRAMGSLPFPQFVAKEVNAAIAARDSLVTRVWKRLPELAQDVAKKNSLDALWGKGVSADAATSESLAKLTEIARKGVRVTLILDEVNLAISPEPTGLGGGESLKTLEHFVRVTKEAGVLGGINVVLSTSTYSYPFALEHGLGFKTNNFGEIVHAGEVCPADMKRLLMEEWGVGNHLCAAMLAHYGGNIYLARRAVEKVVSRRKMPPCAATLIGIDGRISECMAMGAEVRDQDCVRRSRANLRAAGCRCGEHDEA